MHDRWKVLVGIGVFLVTVGSPWWLSAFGEPQHRPKLVLPAADRPCVEPAEFMRAHHMELLLEWREAVVREGRRTYVASDGREHRMSLTGTCMGCHSKKKEFCEECHNHVGAEPACWRCHVEPEAD